jgi:hypothetical protein
VGLTNILTVIEDEIRAVEPGATFLTGHKHLTAHGKPPRVVWVRRASTFGPAQRGSANPRNLRTHLAVVEAHCWADAGADGSDTPTEVLMHNVVAAAYRAAHGCFEVLQAEWDPPEWCTRGAACVVTVQFHIPIQDQILPTAVITALVPDPTGAQSGDGELETGDT